MPEKNRKKINKSFGFLSIILISIFIFSPIMVRRASAQLFVPVWDPANLSANTVTASNATSLSIKEHILDAIVYKVLDLIIQKMAASTVNWINSGFKGKPTFITNPGAFFQDVGDKVAGQYIYANPNLNFLCGPISGRIKIALSNKYRGNDIRWQCTLTDVVDNVEDFMNDFEKGGWDGFFRLTQDPQNNPIGAYIQAEGELARQIAKETDEKNKELSWGKGYFSTTKCPAGRSITNVVDNPEGGKTVTYEDGVTINQMPDPSLKVGGCGVKENIVTPGSVVEGQLGEVLSIGGKKLAVADEINEIISALLNQLVSKAFSGLASLSQRNPTNEGGRSFTELLHSSTTDSVIDNYIESSTETLQQAIQNSIDNPYNPYACRDNPNLSECQVPQGQVGGSGGIDGSGGTRSSCDPTIETCEAQGAPGGGRGR